MFALGRLSPSLFGRRDASEEDSTEVESILCVAGGVEDKSEVEDDDCEVDEAAEEFEDERSLEVYEMRATWGSLYPGR